MTGTKQQKQRKIGIMGGTFDPIHNGHLWIAEHARREYGLSELWFLPAGDPYFKAGKQVTPAKLRLQMTELAVSELPYAMCMDTEVRRSGPTYTADTLREFHKREPEAAFYFIIGADSLFQLEKWHEPEALMRLSVILCAGRPAAGGAPVSAETKRPDRGNEVFAEADRLNQKYKNAGCDIRLIHCEKLDISSTMIRKAVSLGQDISALVPEAVAAFIKKQGLYREQSATGNIRSLM